MKAKKVVRWGLVALVVLSGLTALIVYQTEKISKHEYQWQRERAGGRFTQNVPFAKEKR